MAKPVTRTWYRVALATTAGTPQLVAASGEHMGQALAEAQAEIEGSWPIAVEHATADQIPLGESVGRGHVVRLGDAPAIQPFRWPIGVLPALAGAAGFAPGRRGWLHVADPALHVIEAQTDADHLTDLFLGLVERLPAADNLEVRVLDHFEAAPTTDVWLTSRVDAKRVLRFLDDYDELIDNGHLELNVYIRAHKATLRLTEHKTVVWLSATRELAPEVERWLRELDVPPVDQLVTVGSGPHFHYRRAKSRDRKKLGEELYRQRLRKVDVVKAKP